MEVQSLVAFKLLLVQLHSVCVNTSLLHLLLRWISADLKVIEATRMEDTTF